MDWLGRACVSVNMGDVYMRARVCIVLYAVVQRPDRDGISAGVRRVPIFGSELQPDLIL